VGEGPQKKALESQARDLGIDAQVTFTGEAADVFSVLQRASVFVLPSFSEGLSNAVLEAMACSLPVVATDCGGTPEIITHGSNGILVSPGSADQIYSAIKKIIADRDFACSLGKNARDTVAGTFSISAAADRYCDVYRSLLNS
jgi:glycosyltransferase involved in cell wall biosynthesis